MMNFKKLFTLIELIVVIVILGILAAIVIPSVSDFQKESITAHVQSNTKIIQTAVDTYSLKHNGNFPVAIQPTLENPQLIKSDDLYPEYIKSKIDYEKVKDQKYWVDVYGQIWGATVSSPSNIYDSSSSMDWKHDSSIVGYKIYEVESNTNTGKAFHSNVKLKNELKITDDVSRIQLVKNNTNDNSLLISSIDEYGLESAPAGLSYQKQEDWFTPLLNKEGTYAFELTSSELMYWDGFKTVEDKPNGTSISYRFSVLENTPTAGATGQTNLQYGNFVNDFHSLPPSKGIKVEVTMKGNANLRPSLYDFHIFYHFGDKVLLSTNRVQKINIDEFNKVIDPLSPVKVVDEFTLSNDTKVEDIIISDSYLPNYSVPSSSSGIYYYDNGWKETSSISSIPAGSRVQISREYPNGKDLYLGTPIIYTAPSNSFKVVKEEIAPITAVKEPVLEDHEWKTLDTLRFFAHSGSDIKTNWIKSEISDYQPTGTRIIYRYSYNEGIDWSNEFKNISEVPDSTRLRVIAYLQVKLSEEGKTENPKINSIRILHERGTADVNTVNPIDPLGGMEVALSLQNFSSLVYADAVNGSDTTGDGTEAKPYKTFQKALNMVKTNGAILLRGNFQNTKNTTYDFAAKPNITIIGDYRKYGSAMTGMWHFHNTNGVKIYGMYLYNSDNYAWGESFAFSNRIDVYNSVFHDSSYWSNVYYDNGFYFYNSLILRIGELYDRTHFYNTAFVQGQSSVKGDYTTTNSIFGVKYDPNTFEITSPIDSNNTIGVYSGQYGWIK